MTASPATPPPEFAYHLLRVAVDGFKKSPKRLDASERAKVESKARRSYELETRVLRSAEATDVFIGDEQLDRAIADVQARYEQPSEFEQDLADNGMDLSVLRTALRRELVFDAVLHKVGSRHAAISDIDVALFYELHSDRFRSLERRVARHILITINEAFAENQRPAALARVESIAERLRGRSKRFASLARRHSECPTALEGGRLGAVVRGQLYPQLDHELFKLTQNQVSGIIETELGFHLLWCEKIEPAMQLPLRQAAPKIRLVLEERKRRNCQKAWLAALQEGGHASG